MTSIPEALGSAYAMYEDGRVCQRLNLGTSDVRGIVAALGLAGYAIVPKELSDDVIAAADEAMAALPLEQRRVDGPARLTTLRNIWRVILEKV